LEGPAVDESGLSVFEMAEWGDSEAALASAVLWRVARIGAGPVVLRLPLALLAMIPNGMEVDEEVGRGGRVKVLRVRLLRARLL
jgi:hypothetical protein